jgi:hypothetical protein
MKNKTYLKGALATAIVLFGLVGGLAKANESLEEKTTKYLGIAEQTILPDSSFYLSKNVSRRWDRTFTFNASDKVTVDLEKLSELIRELADAHFAGAGTTLSGKVYELYSTWSSYLATDYAKATTNQNRSDNILEKEIATESLKQLVVINELENDGLNPTIANLFRKTVVQNWTLSLEHQGENVWQKTVLEVANVLENTLTKKDMLDSLDKVVLVLGGSSLSNLLKGVIINLAGLNI